MPADSATCSLVEEESERAELVRPGRGGAARAPGAGLGGAAGRAAATAGDALGLAQQKKGHVEEIEEITGKAEEDPCRNRKGQAGRRLKSKTRAHEVEEKTEIEKLLAQEKADIESEEDPCKLPEEAVLKVQRIIDEEMEGAEFAAHEKEVKYLKEELNKLRGSSKKPHTKIANGTGNSTAKNGSTAKASSKKKAPNITRGREPPPASNCSDADEDCRQTQCCSDPGRQCYPRERVVGELPGGMRPRRTRPLRPGFRGLDVRGVRQPHGRRGGRSGEMPRRRRQLHDEPMLQGSRLRLLHQERNVRNVPAGVHPWVSVLRPGQRGPVELPPGWAGHALYDRRLGGGELLRGGGRLQPDEVLLDRRLHVLRDERG
ncbi:unnamed protein product, partial [Prorocentrum cordatum]